ncbi:MAG: GNAT family N-acetyltransferase [Thermoanaerobaculia bacterium]
MAELTYRYATPDDDERILDLYEASFARRLSPEWWRWFSYSCPNGLNRTTLLEDVDSGALAASYSLLPLKLQLNDRVVEASLATNGNTHPAYQGRGLFSPTCRQALQGEADIGCGVSLGMPRFGVSYPAHVKVGWKTLCKLPFLVNTDLQARANSCREVGAFDERFDAFFRGIAEKYSFIIMKDHRVINWRVAERPDKQYTRFILERGTTLAGYVVLKKFDDGDYRKTHIMDIHAQDESALDELLAAAESFAAGRDELNLWSNRCDPYREQLLARGYVEREGSDLLIMHFNGISEEIVEERAWNFCLADNDVY